jgi:hypothetical protein
MEDKLAIIVPFRDRQKHLDIFVPHMHEFLSDKGIVYDIFIAEQTDDRPFNYGKLCNVIVKEIAEEYTYFCFHDIDMLPIDDSCDYGFPLEPTHLATKVQVHENKLPYPQYFGGVTLISREDFEEANGYSNEYWGYGFEDLDLLYRLKESGAYLEKFYDLNKVYSNYDELDILPYRIEEVEPSTNNKTHKLKCVHFDKQSQGHGMMNHLSKNMIDSSFSISLWFKDDGDIETIKNLFCIEGLDSGLFLNNGKQVMAQIWDIDRKNYEVATEYFRNRWNHIVFILDKKRHKLVLNLNGKKIETTIPADFKIFNEYQNFKISDKETNIDLANIILFNSVLESKHINELYYNGNESLKYIENHFGLIPSSIFDFGNQNDNMEFPSHYKKKLILDKGSNWNHIKVNGSLKTYKEEVAVTDELYLPVRIDGKYNSLTHNRDRDIIERYYSYDPDVEENADIFFHDILTQEIDWKEIGLNSLKYEATKEQIEELNYTLFQIIT